MKNGKKPGLIANNWQEPQQEAFEQLIDAFITAPVLRHYDPDCKLRMETDASGTACAGILSQKWKDGWHPIAYFSRKFSGPELNYPICNGGLYSCNRVDGRVFGITSRGDSANVYSCNNDRKLKSALHYLALGLRFNLPHHDYHSPLYNVSGWSDQHKMG